MTRVTSLEKIDTAQIYKGWCNYFEKVGIKFPEVVTAQMVHETNFCTSKILRENNNMFGMKLNKRGFCSGELNGHAYYKSVALSIMDYREYQRMMLRLADVQKRTPHTNDEYMKLLEDLPHLRGARYAEDKNYIPSLRKRIDILKSM